MPVLPPPVYTAEGDIETVIMQALGQIFQAELITAVPTTDKLRLRTLTPLPLQLDPTTSAPYLAYGPSWELGSTTAEEDLAEIGGGILNQTAFKCVVGIPRQRSKDLAYQQTATLIQRVQRIVVHRHPSLANIVAAGALTSADGTCTIDAQDPSKMWLGTRRRIYGGGTEFYGEALMFWRYTYLQIGEWNADLAH